VVTVDLHIKGREDRPDVPGCRLGLLEMALFADPVGFGHPGAKVVVQVGRAGQPEDMNVIAWRNGLNLPKARMLQSPGENDVPVQPSAARRELRKRHAHLERYPRLFGQDAHRADRPNGRDDGVKQQADFRRLAMKMALELVPTAGMRLIAIRKLTAALAATPER